MNIDAKLVQQIKTHLGKKRTSELERLLAEHDESEWSEEAFAAAKQIIEERQAGKASEPQLDGEREPCTAADKASYRRKRLLWRRRILLVVAALIAGLGILIGESYYRQYRIRRMHQELKEQTERIVKEHAEKQGWKLYKP